MKYSGGHANECRGNTDLGFPTRVRVKANEDVGITVLQSP